MNAVFLLIQICVGTFLLVSFSATLTMLDIATNDYSGTIAIVALFLSFPISFYLMKKYFSN